MKTHNRLNERRASRDKIRRLDESLRLDRQIEVLTEALSEQDQQVMKDVIVRLRELSKQPGCEWLKEPVKKAILDLNDFAGGGQGLKSLFAKGVNFLAKKLKVKGNVVDSPLVKCGVLLSALEHGFVSVEGVAKNNIDGYDPASPKTPKEQGGDDQDSIDTLTKGVKDAFVPEGVFGKLASTLGGGIPYINSDEISYNVVEVMKAVEIQHVAQLAKQNPVTPKAQEAVKDVVQAANEKGDDAGEEKGDSDKEGGDKTDDFVSKVAQKAGVKPDVAKSIIKVLSDAGRLKAEGRRHVVLTTEGLQRAQRLYGESGGSSREWVRLLGSQATPVSASPTEIIEVMTSIEKLMREKSRRRVLA